MIPYNIKYTGIDSSEEIDTYVKDHLSKLDSVVPNSDTSAQAQIELEKTISDQNNGDIYRAEINLHTAKGDFYVDETDFDIFAAIIKMRDAIFRDVSKEAEKLRDNSLEKAREIKGILRKE
jgi:ribosome-associated translation inhibitor RaiA